jgi:hypothetical protein
VAEATDKLSDARRVVEGLESAAKVAEDLGDVSQTIGRLRTQVSIEGLAGQILEEGVELSGDVIKGLSVADRSKLVEQGILVFNEATGGFTYTKKGIEIAEQVAKASDPALAAQINTAREALEKAEYGLKFAQEKALTPLQHKFLQLTGGIPGATDMERSSLALQKGKLLKPWTWFRMTPEAKAQEVINMVGNHMAALIGNADTPEAAAAILRNASSAMATQEMGKLILSVEGRAFTAMINGSDAVAANMIRGWKASEAQRWMLTNVAEFLGKSVDDLVADMAEKDGPGRVMRAITAIVDAPIAKGTSVDAMQTMLKSGLNEDALKKLADFFVDGKIPFSKDTFKLHMIGEVAEIARRNAVAVFGVQTEGMFTKATNALKAAETLA